MAHATPLREVAPILSRNRHALLILTLSGLVFGGVAGCLSDTVNADEPKLLVSRVHTLSIDRESMERADAAGDDPEAALKELLRSDLVVRVDEAGDYSLEYTDRDGAVKTERLVGAAPGLPATVADVDPFAPAKLLKGGSVVFERKGNDQEWWRVGDIPLGLTMTSGAAGEYASRASVTESLALSDIDAPGGGDIHLDSLRFSLRLPMQGTVSYELGAPTPEGAPLDLSATYLIPATDGDIVSAEIKATQNGQSGTAGVVAGVKEALAKGGVRVWIQDGQPVAGQFTGGEVAVEPKVTMWADGFFGDMAEGSSCAGTSRSDNCQPEEIEAYRETFDASEKEEFPIEEFPSAADDPEVKRAADFLRTLFAVDVMQGDKVQLVATFTGEDVPNAPPGFQGESRTEYTMEAVGNEKVSVPAGSFDTVKIVQSLRSRTTSTPFSQDGEVYVKALNVDETFLRTTYWLDAATYQPIKMTAETPVDIDRLLKSVIASIGDGAWEQAGMEPIRENQWKVTASAEASYEATRIAPSTKLSALVGLLTAQALANSGISLPMAGLGMAGMPFGPMDDVGYAEPARPMRSLSLSSNGGLLDGMKSYTVTSVSPDFYWGDILVTLDGEELSQDAASLCKPPVEGMWLACSGTDVEAPWDDITAGDTLRLAAKSGQTMRILDSYTNSVILTLTVS